MERAAHTQIIAFYEFKDLLAVGNLEDIKTSIRELFIEIGVRGTIILAAEGYNGMICGGEEQVAAFIPVAETILQTELVYKSSHSDSAPFRKIDIKIKPEIVTLKKPVDINLGHGTHVNPRDWNEIISAPDTLILDARNDYEYRTGTFRGAINPNTAKFSDLPNFVAENLDPNTHKRVAMFCTGGIRCEKFAPYMKSLGFEEVYQLDGGILKYLEVTPVEQMLWDGECYVFDERVTVDKNLKKGEAFDFSQRLQKRKKTQYKVSD